MCVHFLSFTGFTVSQGSRVTFSPLVPDFFYSVVMRFAYVNKSGVYVWDCKHHRFRPFVEQSQQSQPDVENQVVPMSSNSWCTCLLASQSHSLRLPSVSINSVEEVSPIMIKNIVQFHMNWGELIVIIVRHLHVENWFSSPSWPWNGNSRRVRWQQFRLCHESSQPRPPPIWLKITT